MSQILPIDRFLKLFIGLSMVLCALFATQTAFAQPCDNADQGTEVSGQADSQADEGPCSTPCGGDSDEDKDCSDDCQFCSCCSMAAPAALPLMPVSSGFDVLAYRGDLPRPSSADHGGISLRIFKPPRHLSA